MDSIISRFLFQNWQRKAVAIVSALILWLFVNGSITETKTIPNVPIRIINLPSDKTIAGLLPNRLLSKRVTLTLSGTKDVIQELEPGDLEVLLDVSSADSNEWVVKINKKNLISLNPSIDLTHHITLVEHSELILKLSRLVTAKIPITIMPPIGESPSGYEYLDIWPQKLTQSVSGAEEEIQTLRNEGLKLTINLSDITKTDLDNLKPSQANMHDDEVSFTVPEKWRKVNIPVLNNVMEEINDPEAQSLRIDFLRKEILALNRELPIRAFYPMENSDAINPRTHPLGMNDLIHKKNDIALFSTPLYVRDVSRLFLNIISENLGMVVVAAPKSERDVLLWSLEIVDPHELEDRYVAFLLANTKPGQSASFKRREAMLRKRFREYMARLRVYTSQEKKLHLECTLEANSIKVIPVK